MAQQTRVSTDAPGLFKAEDLGSFIDLYPMVWLPIRKELDCSDQAVFILAASARVLILLSGPFLGGTGYDL